MEEKKVKKKKGCSGCLSIVVIAVLLIGGGIGFWYLRGVYRINKAEQLSGEYLKDKYHQEFTITNGQYVWATNSYTFDASPKDDPDFTFPVFLSNFYKGGIGDMYRLKKEGRATRLLIKPFVESISRNNYFSANFAPLTKMNWKEERKPILSDIRKNGLTPLQAAEKYPGKIEINIRIYYALDVTDQNKDEIFKKVYNLVEFLKKTGFGKIAVIIYFFRPDSSSGKKIINDTFKTSESGYSKDVNYSIGISEKTMLKIAKWNDVGNYLKKLNATTNKWEKVNNISSKSNREVTK
jgi:hypothetical protein